MQSEPLEIIKSAIADLQSITEMYKTIGVSTNRIEALIAELRQSTDALEGVLTTVK